MNYQKINTLFGTIYIDNEDNKKDDRINVYDSDYKYLTYYQSENAVVTQEEKTQYINFLKNAKSLKDIVFEIEYISKNWKEIATKMGIYYGNEQSMFNEILNNEYVNRIGEYYILIEI